jgi:uncharacterized membrane protein YwzB
MDSKGDTAFLIIATLVILFPIAGVTLHFIRHFIDIFFAKEELISKEKRTSKALKLLMVFVMIIYGITLGSFFFWIIWICKNDVSPSIRIVGLFISLPYFIALFTLSYALGPAVAFGNFSINRIIRQIFNKRE